MTHSHAPARRHTHPQTHTVTIGVPRHWTTRSDPEHGLVLLARPPTRTGELGAAYGPELVVRTTPVDTDLATWRAEAVAALAAQLDAFEIEDDDRFELNGRAVVYHRLGYRARGVDVVAEQWAWLIDVPGAGGGIGVTLTGAVARSRYADYADLFEEVAATLDPGDAKESEDPGELSPAPAPGSAHPGEERW
ncbi:hypothetical protein GCM10022237_41680 [Nocardioides ginsengisoli]|uniref:DUF1795 domain-containing protein n=1 Tax=Nocardioides ginsengisoli TaxID=363868 RepID=A0ABW3W4L4_9ACTN